MASTRSYATSGGRAGQDAGTAGVRCAGAFTREDVRDEGTVLRQDLSAGLVVFLVALPLCLGVALASNTPLLAGIIAGMIGGCVVGLLSDSPVSVSGPAAGLAVIVATSIDTLESYEAFLAAVVLAGLMQIVLGVIRAGAIGDYVPNAVIKGMLAGIGLVIVLKQIPHALGYDLSWIGDLRFQEANDGNTLSSLSAAASSMLLGALVVSVCSLVLLILWDRLASRGVPFFTTVPGPLAVVALGIALNQGFRRFAPALYISERKHLVDLPVGSFRDLLHEFAFPVVGGDPRRGREHRNLAVPGGGGPDRSVPADLVPQSRAVGARRGQYPVGPDRRAAHHLGRPAHLRQRPGRRPLAAIDHRARAPPARVRRLHPPGAHPHSPRLPRRHPH